MTARGAKSGEGSEHVVGTGVPSPRPRLEVEELDTDVERGLQLDPV
ncbi:MAG: hypothetical protein P1U38_13755 [Aeromicrobium sp.]|nr:hypothetical protein [Aeromicrobium sp.]MDF1705830.1 hypothetical protein [Aeromicrobium sp.]